MSADGETAEQPKPVAIVTGAAGGIGAAFADRLARLGYRLILIDRDKDRVAPLAERLGPLHTAAAFDVADGVAWDRLAEKLTPDEKPISLLVNCAGVLLAGPLADCDAEAVARLFGANLLGTVHGCRAITPLLADAQQSVKDVPPLPRGVLNVASIFAVVSPPGFAAYNASKAGVVGLTETLRGELRPLGLTATVVLPGVTPTGLFDRAGYHDPRLRELVDRYLAKAELTSDLVAEAALDAHRRRVGVRVIGARARRYAWLKRLFPQRLIDSVARRARQELDQQELD